MRYLTLAEVLELHQRIIAESGGASGVRDMGLYPTLAAKAVALCYSLVQSHPFIDGNKRIGHASMEVFLLLNGHELVADVDSAEVIMLKLAGGELPREELLTWVSQHLRETTIGQ